MSRDELLELLRLLPCMDAEFAHGEAVDALLQYLDDPEVTEAFEAVSA